MKKIELTVMAKNVQSVLDALEAKNIKHLNVSDPEALLAAQQDLAEQPQQKCCGDAKEEVDEKPLSLLQTGKNLLSATKEHISKGMSHVSHDEHIRRLTICKGCEWVKEGFQCGQCHCFMGIKAGWDIKDGCKLNKW